MEFNHLLKLSNCELIAALWTPIILQTIQGIFTPWAQRFVITHILKQALIYLIHQ